MNLTLNLEKTDNDYNTRLKILNKVLRGKLKDLNDRLERVLDKIYVKSLNPNVQHYNETPDISHQIEVANKSIGRLAFTFLTRSDKF